MIWLMNNRWILHPITFAIFPILALLAHNIAEVSPSVSLRPLGISVSASLILFLLTSIISRNWQKAGIATTCCLVLFYSYGHMYELFQKYPILGFSLGRHRYLVVVYSLLLICGIYCIFRFLKETVLITQVLNLVGFFLLITPIVKITSYVIHTDLIEQKVSRSSSDTIMLAPKDPGNLPDVYVIVLDTYTRSDALLRDYNFDNSPFLDELQQIGFYIAECSRVNDPNTHGSLATTLNMDYQTKLNANLVAQGYNPNDIWVLIRQSQVRLLLESIGYSTVAFDSGFEWSRMRDADVYLEYSGKPYQMQVLQPFEVMLIRSTALLLWSDITYKSLPAYTNTIFRSKNFGIEDHINRQLFILDQLPRLSSYAGPKFVFAHILIPHLPFVFSPTGDIQSDPGFYSKDNFFPIDDEYINIGYIDQIQFINLRLIPILQTLITESRVPPIIVLMGDHGLNYDNRLLNLSAYYLPGNSYHDLYPSITPVNSFRVIFDTYFGTDFGLLDDISYDGKGMPVPETYSDCLQK